MKSIKGGTQVNNLKILVVIFLLFIFMAPLLAQNNPSPMANPLKHEKKVYVSEDHRIYLPGRETPLYLRLATSPEDGAENYLLYNEESRKKAKATGGQIKSLPFFMEGPGRHSIVHPSAKYWKEKKVPVDAILTPDRIFYIYVDEDIPNSKKIISKVPQIKKGETTIYGRKITIDLKSTDKTSGVKETYYSLNGAEFVPYSASLNVEKEASYNLRYYSVDNVGNTEKPNVFLFALDLTSPESEHLVKNIHKGDILSPKATFELTSSDNLAGVATTYYQIDSGKERIYTGKVIPIATFRDGEHTLSYYARDKVENTEVKKIYKFYLDKIPPEVKADIVGDQHKKGNVLFVSGRSKVKLTATDNKSGVNQIKYLVDARQTLTYDSPFELPKQSGQHSINYFAIDDVQNISPKKMLMLTLDLTKPNSKYAYIGPHIQVQDTMYISKDTKIKLTASDTQAGVQKIQYQLDGGAVVSYNEPFYVQKHGPHNVAYYSTDKVNNKENENRVEFFVDTEPPVIHHHFSIKTTRKAKMKTISKDVEIYPKNTMVYLGATDESSGVKEIKYRINKGKRKTYIDLLPFPNVGEYTIKIKAIDQVGNVKADTLNFIIKDIKPAN